MKKECKKVLTLELTKEQVRALAGELGLDAQELEIQLVEGTGGLKLLQTRLSIKNLGVQDANN